MQLVSATRFKELNRNRRVTGHAIGLRKQMIAPALQLGGDMRALRFTISTGCVDREMDCVSIAGWDLRNYARNPVVLWAHQSDRLPVGRAFDVAVHDGALMASVEFAPSDIPQAGEFADAVYRLATRGFLAASSVGFRPIKWSFSEDKARGADDWFPGIDFHEQELVEFSLVTVPANPEALIEPDIGGGIGETADASPVSHEEITALVAATAKQEPITARARRRRVLQLVTLRDSP